MSQLVSHTLNTLERLERINSVEAVNIPLSVVNRESKVFALPMERSRPLWSLELVKSLLSVKGKEGVSEEWVTLWGLEHIYSYLIKSKSEQDLMLGFVGTPLGSSLLSELSLLVEAIPLNF